MADEADTVRLRVEIIVGLLIGLAHGKEIFEIVKNADDSVAALATLRQKRFAMLDDARAVLGEASSHHSLTERQAQAILNNRLNRFTRRERHEFLEELRRLVVMREESGGR